MGVISMISFNWILSNSKQRFFSKWGDEVYTDPAELQYKEPSDFVNFPHNVVKDIKFIPGAIETEPTCLKFQLEPKCLQNKYEHEVEVYNACSR